MSENNSLNRSNLLKSQANEQFKQHLVYDAQDRIQFVFSAKIGAGQDDPCLAVEYVYRDGTSTQVVKMQERVSKWQSAWETGAPAFTFDPNAVYDANGDGIN